MTTNPAAWQRPAATIYARRTTVRHLAIDYTTKRAKRSEIAPASARTYQKDLMRFVRHVGFERSVVRVTRAHVESFLERPVAPATKRRELSTLRSFFAWVVRQGYRRTDPTAGVVSPRQPRHVPRALRTEQARTVAGMTGDNRMALCISLGLQEGLRVGEIAGLQRGDVDLGERVLRVKGKSGHQRVLPISEETMAAIEAYLPEAPGSAGPLIRSRTQSHRGLTAQTLSHYVSVAMHAAGVPAVSHQLRHTMAWDTLRHGANIRELQQALGHASLHSTETYLGFASVADLRKAMGGRHYRRPYLLESAGAKQEFSRFDEDER